MVSRFIDALDASNNVVATYEETDDSKNRWKASEIFPNLIPNESYNFVMRTPETAPLVFPQLLPIITGVPTISGVIRTGQVLTATAATTENSSGRTWQWRRNGVDIVGATGSAYTLRNLDEGKSITVRQIETNPNGSVNAVSAATEVPFLLDQLTAVSAGAYSFRKLRGAATLAARMRVSTTETDFGFAADGQFDQSAFDALYAANVDVASTTWYDQSPAAVNYTQVTTTRQPFSKRSSANMVNNGKMGLFFESQISTNAKWFSRPAFLYAAGKATGFFVIRETTLSDTDPVMQERLVSAGNGGARYEIRNETFSSAGFNIKNDAGTDLLLTQNLANGSLSTVPTITAFRDTGTNLRGFKDGAGGANINYTRSGVLTLDTHRIGGTADFGGASNGCVYSEIIWFTTDISDLDLNTIIASQGGEYGIATVPFLQGEDLEFAGLTRDGLFAEQNLNWDGYTLSFSRSDEPNSGAVGYPNMFRRMFKASSGAANRINTGVNELNNFDSYTKNLYIGGTARVYRVTNGVMNLIRSSEITDARVGKWNWLRFQTSGADDSRVIDGTSYRYTFDTFNRANVPYWFRVAAVGADGLAGTWSSPVAYTPTSVGGAANNVPNTPKAFNRTGSGGALAAPTGLAAVAGVSPRVASLTWSAVAGAEGYIVELSYYDPATDLAATPYLDLASHANPILAGDMVIVERQLLTLNDNFYAPRLWAAGKPLSGPPLFWFDNQILKRDGCDWSYVAYSGDKPAQARGDHFLRRVVPAGATAQFQRFWFSGTDQTFYQVLVPGVTYRLRVVMRASSPVNVNFNVTGAAVGITGTVFNNVGSTFAEYTHDMVPTTQPGGSTPYDFTMNVTAGGTPVNLDIAFFAIERVGASSNIIAATPPGVGAYLRDHSFIKPGPNNRSLVRLITNNVYGFKAFYDTCVQNSVKPWFQIEWNTPQADWVDFVAYLAAPNGAHPMADLRLASGIPEPWTTTFPSLKLEMGNESWNPTSGFWIFPTMTDSANATAYGTGSVAGLFWQMISNWMKASPYWSILEPKLIQHAGGWMINQFGEDAYRYYPDAKEVSGAAYNGGWESSSNKITETGVGYDVILCDPILVQKPRAKARVDALKALCTSLGRTYGSAVRYGVYEGGPGYQLNGLNGVTLSAAEAITQEIMMKSRAAAAATVDTMLTYAQQDFKDFNFFTLTQGSYWSSHSGAIDGSQEYMTHALLRIIHEQIAPAKVYGAPTSTIGTKQGRLANGTFATMNEIGAYQLRSLATPSKRMIVLVNRNIDPSQLDPSDPLYNATPSGSKLFNVTTTWTGATSLKAWTAGIGPYRQHNRYPVGQRRVAAGGLTADPLCVTFNYSPTTLSVPSNIQNFPVNASVGATANGLPAGNVLILLFEGVTGG